MSGFRGLRRLYSLRFRIRRGNPAGSHPLGVNILARRIRELRRLRGLYSPGFWIRRRNPAGSYPLLVSILTPGRERECQCAKEQEPGAPQLHGPKISDTILIGASRSRIQQAFLLRFSSSLDQFDVVAFRRVDESNFSGPSRMRPVRQWITFCRRFLREFFQIVHLKSEMR